MTDNRPLIVLDVNETLLNIDVLEPLFDHIFVVKGRMREWFAQLIVYSQTLTLTGAYVSFGTLGAGVLRMLGQIHGISITDANVRELGATIANLPVHSDVPVGLACLKDAGFTLVTLSNTAAEAGPNPLDKAGLGTFFDRQFSVEPVRSFKPAPATYNQVTNTMKVAHSDTWLVAAHTWDTIGAQSFGWNAALVTRGINAPLVFDGVPAPTLTGARLTDVADAIVQYVALGGPS